MWQKREKKKDQIQWKIMAEQPLVSVIVPVYNRHKYLSKCLDSLLAQTYRNLEIILVDDGSTDDSLDICRRYAANDDRCTVVTQANAGVARARNVGMNIAKGRYIMFVDSDDYVSSDYCQSAINELTKTGADVCCMSFIDVKLNGQTIKHARNLPAGMITKQQALEITIDDSYLWDKAFRADLIKQFAFPENKLYEDVYVVYKIFAVAQSFCYVPQPSYYYVVRQDSIVSNMNAATIADQFASSDEQYRFFSKNIPKLPIKWTVYAGSSITLLHLLP